MTNICQTSHHMLRAPSGFIISPKYPQKYPPSRQCSVKILVPKHQSIKVYLLDLYLAYYNYDNNKQCVDALWIVGRKFSRFQFSFKSTGCNPPNEGSFLWPGGGGVKVSRH